MGKTQRNYSDEPLKRVKINKKRNKHKIHEYELDEYIDDYEDYEDNDEYFDENSDIDNI